MDSSFLDLGTQLEVSGQRHAPGERTPEPTGKEEISHILWNSEVNLKALKVCDNGILI
jgi:hypothetical protein